MTEIVYTHRTRSGLKARIVCDNAKGERPIVALVLIDDFEFIVKLYSDLREYNDTTESYYDLFEYNPWQDVAVDTPVYVSCSPGLDDWHRRHFAKFEDDVAYVWEDGRSPWTTSTMVIHKYANWQLNKD